MMEKTVRALDVGYGNVKFVKSQATPNSKPVVDSFPSRVVVSNDTDITGGMLSRRRTVHVEVQGKKYEVGYDVALAQGTHNETISLDKDFCTTSQYLARALGAFYCMYDDLGSRKEIDLLVCGLPVNTYITHRAELMKILTNEFKLPGGKQINRHNVLTCEYPVFANVIGFQRAGILLLAKQEATKPRDESLI